MISKMSNLRRSLAPQAPQAWAVSENSTVGKFPNSLITSSWGDSFYIDSKSLEFCILRGAKPSFTVFAVMKTAGSCPQCARVCMGLCVAVRVHGYGCAVS